MEWQEKHILFIFQQYCFKIFNTLMRDLFEYMPAGLNLEYLAKKETLMICEGLFIVAKCITNVGQISCVLDFALLVNHER